MRSPGEMLTVPLFGSISPERIFKKSGFTCPVGADDTITVAFSEVDVHFIKKHPFTKGEGYIVY